MGRLLLGLCLGVMICAEVRASKCTALQEHFIGWCADSVCRVRLHVVERAVHPRCSRLLDLVPVPGWADAALTETWQTSEMSAFEGWLEMTVAWEFFTGRGEINDLADWRYYRNSGRHPRVDLNALGATDEARIRQHWQVQQQAKQRFHRTQQIRRIITESLGWLWVVLSAFLTFKAIQRTTGARVFIAVAALMGLIAVIEISEFGYWAIALPGLLLMQLGLGLSGVIKWINQMRSTGHENR